MSECSVFNQSDSQASTLSIEESATRGILLFRNLEKPMERRKESSSHYRVVSDPVCRRRYHYARAILLKINMLLLGT